jgi:hypothetical protein
MGNTPFNSSISFEDFDRMMRIIANVMPIVDPNQVIDRTDPTQNPPKVYVGIECRTCGCRMSAPTSELFPGPDTIQYAPCGHIRSCFEILEEGKLHETTLSNATEGQ